MHHPLEDLPIYQLSEQFKKEPSKKLAWDIIDHFFQFYQESGVEQEIYFLVWITLTSDDESILQRDRVNMLYTYEYFKRMAQALYYLHKQK